MTLYLELTSGRLPLIMPDMPSLRRRIGHCGASFTRKIERVRGDTSVSRICIDNVMAHPTATTSLLQAGLQLLYNVVKLFARDSIQHAPLELVIW